MQFLSVFSVLKSYNAENSYGRESLATRTFKILAMRQQSTVASKSAPKPQPILKRNRTYNRQLFVRSKSSRNPRETSSFAKVKRKNQYEAKDLMPLVILLLSSYMTHMEAIVTNSQSVGAANFLSDDDFTFMHNGSFLQLDAGKEWPFNSKREISFRFKTRSPHGLLLYQTFDHSKLAKEEDQEILDLIPPTPPPIITTPQSQSNKLSDSQRPSPRHQILSEHLNRPVRSRSLRSVQNEHNYVKKSSRTSGDGSLLHDLPLKQLSTSTITATASERLVNSLLSSSPAATINGNHPRQRNSLATQTNSREGISLTASREPNAVSAKELNPTSRAHRVLTSMAHGSESAGNRGSHSGRSNVDPDVASTVISSSAISSYSASLYELYLKLENGRMKIMYEFGSRLNQTYCGRGLNDNKWHRVDLKVDPELNQMILIIDQSITVEIVLAQSQPEDELVRRNDLVFTNSILYLGGLDTNASIVRNVKQRLYVAQFIGCIGQIMLKTDQHTEASLQPVAIDRMILSRRGCINRCDFENYCLHKSTCINYYTHTKCDCFGTNFEDIYCWQRQLTTLTMLGYSTLVYRIYDWRDRHHSSINRLSIQFKTLALDSILFFAYGDLSAQQSSRNFMNIAQANSNAAAQVQPITSLPMNTSNLIPSYRMNSQPSSNYLAVSLANGTLVLEVNFGDQPILLSNLLYDKIYNGTAQTGQHESNPTPSLNELLNLSDGRWHNITFLHNNKQLSLHVDNFFVNYTLMGKNSHLYFDPSVYVGAVPSLLFNETRTLSKQFNLRHKFVGCLRSVYFNQQNLLLSLKQNSKLVEYRDVLGKARLDSCSLQEPSALPLTLRSGKSYLTFQLTPSAQFESNEDLVPSNNPKSFNSSNSKQSDLATLLRKLTRIQFEYKTTLKSHFLAGGHLRDLGYHDLGGFWTLHAKENCQLYFTISSGLTFEPEQIIKLNSSYEGCNSGFWFRVSISMISGDRVLNVTLHKAGDDLSNDTRLNIDEMKTDQSYHLKSSVELLHQVQIGGDLAKFGESQSVPFTGCLRKIKINGRAFDSRDFVTHTFSVLPPISSINQINTTSVPSRQAQSEMISSRISQGYVTLDSCQLVNPCTTANPCQNNGSCKLNELGEPECDCSRTGYTGKTCHFSIYKQSCQDLFLSGQRKSSHYLIDLDRNGPLRPIRVRCNMDEGNGNVETLLSHNLPAEYLVRRSATQDMLLDITYLAFHHMYSADGFYNHDDSNQLSRHEQDSVLRSLISQSSYCRQYFRYECRSAPLELGNKTWMEAPFPKNHRISSLNGINRGMCTCATTEKRCLDPNRSCNCDAGQPFWSEDSYELIGRDDVGLTRIVILKQDLDDERILFDKQQPLSNQKSQSRFTLGDLKCYGTKQHESQHEITFKTSDAYIEVPGWRRGDISFSFRTASDPPAIILYQLATSRNHGYFRMTLISDTRLMFEFIVNRKPRKLSLTSAHKLNNGEWQQVFIESDPTNLRLIVNDDSVMVDLDTNDYLGTFEGPLFIGGAPSKYLVGDVSKRNGFTGCFRGLTIDGRLVDLKSYLSPSMPTVTSACRPSCVKNLCQNGGRCIEYWGSYECECSNPIAHSGSNCEINLNTNSITFVTEEAYYVQVTNNSLLYSSFMMKNMLLNIRTYQETALILYASDHLNNFIQLHKNGSSLVLTFNSNATIITAQVPIVGEFDSIASIPNQVANVMPTLETNINLSPSNLTQAIASNTNGSQSSPNKQSFALNSSVYSLKDKSIRISNTSGSGQPIQVKIERHRSRTSFYVNNNLIVIEKPMLFLTNYTQNPWSNPELELVRPPRPKMGSKSYFQIFLANVDEYFSSRLPGFTGCIQGLSIDNQLFDFNRAHLTGELKGEYRIGCKMRCDSLPCKNQGTCIENWKEDKIQCKCESTSYVGSLCDEDVAAVFNGQTSYFLYNLTKKFSSIAPKLKPISGINFESDESNNFNSTDISMNDEHALEQAPSAEMTTVLGNPINFFEISLAFSTDTNQSLKGGNSSVQTLVLITHTNSSEHFFLGLTSDGSLLIQEDFGHSMCK